MISGVNHNIDPDETCPATLSTLVWSRNWRLPTSYATLRCANGFQGTNGLKVESSLGGMRCGFVLAKSGKFLQT